MNEYQMDECQIKKEAERILDPKNWEIMFFDFDRYYSIYRISDYNLYICHNKEIFIYKTISFSKKKIDFKTLQKILYHTNLVINKERKIGDAHASIYFKSKMVGPSCW